MKSGPRNVIKTMELLYKKAPHFEKLFPVFESVFAMNLVFLIDLNISSLNKTLEILEKQRLYWHQNIM